MQINGIKLLKLPVTTPPANDNFGEKAPLRSSPVHLDPPFAITRSQWGTDTTDILASQYFISTVRMLDTIDLHEFSAVNTAISLDNLNKSGGKVGPNDFLRLVCSGIEESFPLLSVTDVKLNEDDPFHWFFRLGQAAELMKETVFYNQAEWLAFCSRFLFDPIFRGSFTKRFLSIPHEIGLKDMLREAKLNQDLFSYGEIASSSKSAERIYFDVFYRLDAADAGDKLGIIKELFAEYADDEGHLAIVDAALADHGIELAPTLIENVQFLGEVNVYDLIDEMVAAENDRFFADADNAPVRAADFPVSAYLAGLLKRDDLNEAGLRIIKTVLGGNDIGYFALLREVFCDSPAPAASLILGFLRNNAHPDRLLAGILWALSPDTAKSERFSVNNYAWQVAEMFLEYLSREVQSFECSAETLRELELRANQAERKELNVPEPIQKYFEYELSKIFYVQLIMDHLEGQPAKAEVHEAVTAAKMLLDYMRDDYPTDFIPTYISKRFVRGPISNKTRLSSIRLILRNEALEIIGNFFKTKGLLKYFPEILIFGSLINDSDREMKTNIALKTFTGNLRIWAELLSLLGRRHFAAAFDRVATVIRKAKEFNPDFSENEIRQALEVCGF